MHSPYGDKIAFKEKAMISRDDLRKSFIFQTLPDRLLDAVCHIATTRACDEGEQIYGEGEISGNLYMVLSGGVLIEQDISDEITVNVGNLDAGECFGYSSVMGESSFTASAVASEKTELVVINGQELLKLMEKNHTLGYMIQTQVIRIMSQRIERRTEQFLRALSTHPEIHDLKK